MRLRAIVLLAALPLAACGPGDTSDTKANAQQEALANESVMKVGIPAIVNFQEKRTLKMVYELRDKAIATTTYYTSLDGKLWKLCDSSGYGIPAATQYTSPQKVISAFASGHYVPMPQADPNGLFSPPTAEGTWVTCRNPEDNKLGVVYAEPRVIVSPFPLHPTQVQ